MGWKTSYAVSNGICAVAGEAGAACLWSEAIILSNGLRDQEQTESTARCVTC